jgi:hypothetical protein
MYLSLENLRQTPPYTNETSLRRKSREEQNKQKKQRRINLWASSDAACKSRT